MNRVKIWTEMIRFPTYRVGPREKNPLFLEKRVYQGASGVVYPHAVIESVSDRKEPREYNAVFLENEYLKVMILPELGGRIQRAYDKIRQRDFIYYNHVIKPALVGLTGPWISGGIEFNWPQHHRPSTFEPVDFTMEEHEDGSATVWVNEVEAMFRTQGAAGFTLYPDKAFIEIKGRVYNRTKLPQTFLWWANPAVKVNEHYRSIFPPDVYAVFDHGKREVSDFPIATGTYYKVNYAPGTDISRYDTIPVPTSYMAVDSKYNFMGGYEADTDAGMLHVADHHFAPGKKQWTWGNGDFGHAWDRHLTDEDGPYIELMTGVYTDNQPDFSWLMPNEEKTFEQYFMPFSQTGGVKNASKEAVINIIPNEMGNFDIRVYATAAYKNCNITILKNGSQVQSFTSDISPRNIFSTQLITGENNPDLTEWEFRVVHDGKVLVSYQKEKAVKKEIPPAASAALPPKEIKSVEELYLNGLHLEQYRHATFNPIDYYKEGLRRDPGNAQCNQAMGLLLMRRGRFDKAEPFFRKAIERLTLRNPNPITGEAYYYLGICLRFQEKDQEAYDCFYKSVWNDGMQHAGFLELAKLKVKEKSFAEALYLIDKSLVRNAHSNEARHLKTIVLRKLGRQKNAEDFAEASIEINFFNFGCQFERLLINGRIAEKQGGRYRGKFVDLMRNHLNNYLELSLDYSQSGCFTEAEQVLCLFLEQQSDKSRISPLCYYYLGYFSLKNGEQNKANEYFEKARAQHPEFVFPNKLPEINILNQAIALNPKDSFAYYYLGNLWYDKRQYSKAINCWEKSAELNNRFPTVFRNLSLAYFNKRKDPGKSLRAMERAFDLDQGDARVLMELDQLYKVLGRPFSDRLDFLEKHADLVEKRDDLYIERITLYNNLENFVKAKDFLSQRHFHPWEGGEGKVIGQFTISYTELARKAIESGDYDDALELLNTFDQYPLNLGEGKLITAQENDIFYLKGLALKGAGQVQQAREFFVKTTRGISEPVQAIYYNDPQPDKIFYQGLAQYELGNQGKGQAIFKRLLNFGERHYDDEIHIDYFAVSLPDLLVFDVDLDLRNKIHCKYLMGLGHLGLSEFDEAQSKLREVLAMDINHQGAASFLRLIPFLKSGIGNKVITK